MSLVEYGDISGTPVVYFHGAPGSHIEAVAFDKPAVAAGIRLIVPDRPGMGTTPLTPHHHIVVEYADTVVALADHLELDRFAIIGVSGGGPYALACAHRLPDRVTTAVVVSSPAPLEASAADSADRTIRRRRRLLMLLRHFPFLAQPIASRLSSFAHKPGGIAALVAQMSPPDRARIAADPEVAAELEANITEAFRQGSGGVAADLQAVTRPWGFQLANITVPVHIWHGAADNNVPVTDGRQLAAALPNARLDILPEAGHLLFVEQAEAILASSQESLSS